MPAGMMLTSSHLYGDTFKPLSAQPYKMIKHTQTIHRQQPANCLSVFDHCVGLALKGLK